MQEERQAPQPEVLQAESADSTASMGKPRKMGVLSNSMIRFKKPKRKKARAIAALTKKPEEQNETLKERRGLCCMVIPSCQRFNNIQCFLIFFYVLLLSQGEPGVCVWGRGGGGGSRGAQCYLSGGGRRGARWSSLRQLPSLILERYD